MSSNNGNPKQVTKFAKPKIKQLLTGEVAKVDDEATYRKKLEVMARTLGCLPEYLQIVAKFDGLMSKCTNLQERKAMATMGILEIHELLNSKNSVGIGVTLVIDGQVIIEQKPSE